jgi:hypothetical protein
MGVDRFQCGGKTSRRNLSRYDLNRFTNRRQFLKQNAFPRLQPIENTAGEGHLRSVKKVPNEGT